MLPETKHLTQVSCSIRFEPESLEELLGEVEYRALVDEVANDDPMEEPPFRRVIVIVDGYHVRAAIRRHYGQDDPTVLADWLDRLGNWLGDNFMTDEYGLDVYVRAWNAHIPDGKKGEKAFKSLSPQDHARYANARGEKYRGLRTAWLSADWHFTDLRILSGTCVQSGVDARISADLIGSALEKPDALFLITGDQDFELALEVVKKIDGAPQVKLLTLQRNGGPENVLTGIATDRWLVHPEHMGPDFARQL